MAKQKAEPKYACAICGKKQTAERMVYSRWTKARYCAYDIDTCASRGKKVK